MEALRQFPFLDSNDVINDLVTELPNYLAAAQDVIMPCEEDKVKWWRQQSDNLPHWSSAVIKVLLVCSHCMSILYSQRIVQRFTRACSHRD